MKTITDKRNLGAFIFQVHLPDTSRYTTLPESIYSTFFSIIDESVTSKLSFQMPRELIISPSSVLRTVKIIQKTLSPKNRVKCHTISFELLDSEVGVHVYDDLCESIKLALATPGIDKPWCVLIVVSNPLIFQESVFLERRLTPICKENKIVLILSSDDPRFSPIVISRGRLPSALKLSPLLTTERYSQKSETRDEVLSEDRIASLFQIIYGHFEVNVKDKIYHVSAIASVKKLAHNQIFLRQLNNDIFKKLGDENFRIFTFGINGGGMDELAFKLVEGQVERLWDESKLDVKDDRPVALITDFLSQRYPIEHTINQFKKTSASAIVVVCIAKCLDAPALDGTPSISYIDTNYTSADTNALKNDCKFCKQGVQPIKGDYFDESIRNIYEFDAFTFWEFIAQNSTYHKVGHWPSNRTSNHYLFRILTKPIFKHHGFGLALRLRNILDSKNIVPTWIKKIVCTEGEESYILSLNLAEILGLRPKDVVRIPRKYFSSIAGKQIGEGLVEYLESMYGEDTLKQRNVIIVDQAAHHFKTLSALKNICEYYDCTVLAFAVFIDRADPALSLGEYLPESLYIALYSWPVPPRRSYECPCVEV